MKIRKGNRHESCVEYSNGRYRVNEVGIGRDRGAEGTHGR